MLKTVINLLPEPLCIMSNEALIYKNTLFESSFEELEFETLSGSIIAATDIHLVGQNEVLKYKTN